MDESRIKKALGGHREDEEKPELETHEVHYKRADNGGFHAHVHKRVKGPGGTHHHTEIHVLPDAEAAKQHFDEHMGDQPPAGEMDPEEEQAETAPPDAGATAPAGM